MIVTRMQQVQQRRKSLSSSSSSSSPPAAAPFPSDPMHKLSPPSAGSNAGAVANGTGLSDTDKVLVRQRIAKLALLLPRVDSLLGDETRRAALSSPVQRQLQTIVRTRRTGAFD